MNNIQNGTFLGDESSLADALKLINNVITMIPKNSGPIDNTKLRL